MNGSSFNLSSLLCSRDNASCSKEPKYTSKSSSTHPYQRTYALSKQFQEIECQSYALFDEILEHARLVRSCTTRTSFSNYWLVCRLAFMDMKMFFPKKIQSWICQQTSDPVLWTWPKPSPSSSTLRVLYIHLTEKHQHRPALVSSSKSFEISPPQRQSDRLGEVAKPAVDAGKKHRANKESNFQLLRLHDVR